MDRLAVDQAIMGDGTVVICSEGQEIHLSLRSRTTITSGLRSEPKNERNSKGGALRPGIVFSRRNFYLTFAKRVEGEPPTVTPTTFVGFGARSARKASARSNSAAILSQRSARLFKTALSWESVARSANCVHRNAC
jgi:hypothetical protein